MLGKATIEKILCAALETGGDFAEIFIEDKTSSNFNMIGGVLEKAISGRDFGIGIRILKNDYFVYAYTNEFSEENLIKVARTAAQGISTQKKNITIDLRKSIVRNMHEIRIMPDTVSKREKIDWLRRAHQTAKFYDSVITETYTSFSDSVQNIIIANTEGLLTEDTRCRSNLGISVMAEENSIKEMGNKSSGYFGGLEYMRQLDIEACAVEAASKAKNMLKAGYAPSGKFPVIIGNGFGGVWFHEACGHGLETTCVANKASIYADKLEQFIASPLVTAYDDGTLTNTWGSSNIDDEGVNTKRNLLIKDGMLKGYIIDRLGSIKMGMPSTGSGRRESYKFAPTSRMNNTFIAQGQSKPEDIIKNTEYGIYAKYLGGGSVNPATGDYNFSVSEGYIIKNGKITELVKGAALIGNGLDTLKKIDMVGNDLKLEMGTCSSQSGSIPVTVGQPTVRISELTVGGREEE
ncbi:TldD/PmbA family protein [Clostridium sp. P21]|uniref:TldD/PmbA family protein n=1 Tax=Clostridium muellerianum TaxID=2716538 RepID=A0A7Y0ELA1_9CLOT|nr:TldD/PmbA family protein [Clostridium muellerianum]NMM64495.1 TldD/PmbA family protein [Clostridium muellerianum]